MNFQKHYLCVVDVLRRAGDLLVRRQGEVSGGDGGGTPPLPKSPQEEKSIIKVWKKKDNSPVTIADTESEAIIKEGLRKIFGDIPVVSEESFAGENVSELKDEFIVVDPLDGTKSYIRGEKTFCINMAIVRGGAVEVAMIHIPCYEVTYTYLREVGTFVIHHSKDRLVDFRDLQLRFEKDKINIIASKNHLDEATKRFIAEIEGVGGNTSVYNMGSAVKFCLICEKVCHVYPRMSYGTYVWDMVPGMALVVGSGGLVVSTHQPPYDSNMRVHPFICIGEGVTNSIIQKAIDIFEHFNGKAYIWKN